MEPCKPAAIAAAAPADHKMWCASKQTGACRFFLPDKSGKRTPQRIPGEKK